MKQQLPLLISKQKRYFLHRITRSVARFATKIQVRYRDLDTYGHVNNAVYLTYFEIARVGAFLDLFSKNPDIRFVIAHASVDFLKPARLAQELTVHTWVSRIGNTSFTLEYEIKNEEGDLIAKGSTIQVTIDSEGRKEAIPDTLKVHLETLLAE